MANLYHDEILTQEQRDIVDTIFDEVNCWVSDTLGLNVAMDDRAERFIDAIAQYLVDSGVLILHDGQVSA